MSCKTACDLCPGRCCTNKFGYRYLPLSKEEATKPVFAAHLRTDRPWGVPESAAGYISLVPQCPYLLNGRCSIYEDRPAVCRDFLCYEFYKQSNTSFIARHMQAQPELMMMLRDGGFLPSEKEEKKADDLKSIYRNLHTKYLRPRMKDIFDDL